MKKIFVSKRTWRQLCKIKSKQNLSSLSKVVDYLVNSQHVLKGESMEEIHRHVDVLNAKNLEENMKKRGNDF